MQVSMYNQAKNSKTFIFDLLKVKIKKKTIFFFNNQTTTNKCSSQNNHFILTIFSISI